MKKNDDVSILRSQTDELRLRMVCGPLQEDFRECLTPVLLSSLSQVLNVLKNLTPASLQPIAKLVRTKKF